MIKSTKYYSSLLRLASSLRLAPLIGLSVLAFCTNAQAEETTLEAALVTFSQ